MADRITLEDLRPAEGSTHRTKRVGRGRSSGHGKMPKLKGFTNFAALNCAEINVKDIEKLDAAEIDLTWLIENGKAHPKSEVLRVLGNGEISKSVTVKARYFTPSAKEKIEKAGGKAELV